MGGAIFTFGRGSKVGGGNPRDVAWWIGLTKCLPLLHVESRRGIRRGSVVKIGPERCLPFSLAALGEIEGPEARRGGVVEWRLLGPHP